MDKIKPYLKAIFAFITPGAILLGSAVLEDSPGKEHIVQGEWVRALVACVVASGAVFLVPNKDPKGQHQDESVQPEPEPEDEHPVEDEEPVEDEPGVAVPVPPLAGADNEPPMWGDHLRGRHARDQGPDQEPTP